MSATPIHHLFDARARAREGAIGTLLPYDLQQQLARLRATGIRRGRRVFSVFSVMPGLYRRAGVVVADDGQMRLIPGFKWSPSDHGTVIAAPFTHLALCMRNGLV